MKYIFFGTPDFSAHCLEALLKHDIIPEAVVCNPDRPIGRKKIITPPPVKTLIIEWCEKTGRNIEILQPEKLDAEFQAKLRTFEADLFIVFAYNKILRKEVLNIPPLGTVGVHPSLLPAYRGPSPFQSAILNGETQTGVTLYFLDEGIDSGPIITTSDIAPITDEDTFRSLAYRLSNVGANLLIETLPKIMDGKIISTPQEETRATFTKKFKTEDGFVEPDGLAAAERGDKEKSKIILRKIHAFTPEPSCWTIRNGKRVKLLEAKLEADGVLHLTSIQEEGQRPRNV